jgi:hypothetical protein
MAISSEIAVLKRSIASLRQGVATDLKARPPMAEADRRMLKRELDACMQSLDELRTSVAR